MKADMSEVIGQKIDKPREILANYIMPNGMLEDRRICFSEVERPIHIQAFINNISFPKTIEELKFYLFERGHFNVEDILMDNETCWTAPKWAKIGDIVFFMHAKTARSTITALRTKLLNTRNEYPAWEYDCMMEGLERGLQLHQKYGGKIYAIAQVSGAPEYDEYDGESTAHWASRVYADMDNMTVLDVPIDISEFNDFIFVTRGSGITPVFGKAFDQLKDVIRRKNDLPDYVEIRDAIPIPLMKITSANWMLVTNEYRRAFILESQFRSYYVDYLLSAIGDQKMIYRECRCKKTGEADSFVDNVMLIGGKYLPVEVKLSIAAGPDIRLQAAKYCDDDEVILNKKTGEIIQKNRIYSKWCLVVDTEHIFLYSYKADEVELIYDLEDLKGKKDLDELRRIIIEKICDA